jgi:hypothetical protein
MAPNRDQTFMTPAKKKTRVYFMWDFVGRTLGMLYRIPPNLPASVTDKEDNVWMDVVGRSNSFLLHCFLSSVKQRASLGVRFLFSY